MKHFRILLFSIVGSLMFGFVTEAYSAPSDDRRKCHREIVVLVMGECGELIPDYNDDGVIDRRDIEAGRKSEEFQNCRIEFISSMKPDPEAYLTDECANLFRLKHELGGRGDQEDRESWHCEICDLDFDSAEEMAGHLEDDAHAEEVGHLGDDHGGAHGWHCAICDLDFDSAEEMDAHAEEAGHLKPEYCKKQFRRIVRQECSEFERGTNDFKRCFIGVRNKVRDDLENHLSPECHDVFLNSRIGKGR